MAGNEGRGSGNSFRRNQASRKRREPPVIDGTAVDVTQPEADVAETLTPAETVEVGSQDRSPSSDIIHTAAAETIEAPPSSDNLSSDRDIEPGAESLSVLHAEATSAGEPTSDLISGASPPAASEDAGVGRASETGSDALTGSPLPGAETPANTAADEPTASAGEIGTIPGSGDTVSGSASDEPIDDRSDAAPITEPRNGEPATGFATLDAVDAAPATPTFGSKPADPEVSVPSSPAPEPGRRSRAPLWLGAAALVLLAGIAALLFMQRSAPGDTAATLDDLKRRMAALETKPPATPPADPRVAALDRTTADLGAQITGLQKSLADVASRSDAAAASVKTNADRIDAIEARESASGTPAVKGSSPDAGDPALSALSAKVEDLSKRATASPADLATLRTDVQGLTERLAALAKAVDALPRIDTASLVARLDKLDAAAGAADARVAALAGAVAALPKVDLAPLQGEVAALDKRIAPLEVALSAPKAGDRVTEARAVGEGDPSRAAAMAVAAQALSQAVDDGRSYAPELAALRALGVEDATLAPLDAGASAGAPTVAGLRDRWAAVEPAVIDASRPAGGSVLDRFAAGARGLVQIHPSAEAAASTGEDPAALASRIRAATARGDVASALADWAKLPEAARKVSQGWADTARARLDASNVAQSLVSRAISLLGKAGG